MFNNNNNALENLSFERGDRIAVTIPAFTGTTFRGIFIRLEGNLLTWVAALPTDSIIGATVNITNIEGGTITKLS